MGIPFTYPFDCFMGLQSNGVEVSGAGYTRRPATFDDTGDGIIGANVASVQWPACGSDWGFIDAVNLYDALTGGALVCTEQTNTIVQGNLYDVLRVSAGDYEVDNTGSALSPASVGTPYEVYAYNVGPYQVAPKTIRLLPAFDSIALCGNQPGVWAPGPFDVVAVL